MAIVGGKRFLTQFDLASRAGKDIHPSITGTGFTSYAEFMRASVANSLSEQNTQFQSLAEFVLEKLRLKVIGYQAGLVSSTTGVHGLARLAIGLSVVLLVLVALYRQELKLIEESSLMRMHSITYHLFMAQNVIGR